MQQDGYLQFLEKKVAAAREDIAAGRVRDAEDVERGFAGHRAEARAKAAAQDINDGCLRNSALTGEIK